MFEYCEGRLLDIVDDAWARSVLDIDGACGSLVLERAARCSARNLGQLVLPQLRLPARVQQLGGMQRLADARRCRMPVLRHPR